MPRSSRSNPAEEFVALPESEHDSESEEDAKYSGEEPEASGSDEDEDDQDDEGDAGDGSEEGEEEVTAKDDGGIDPYAVLGVSRDASPTEIKKVYHKAALKHHPDKVPVSERESADAKFKEIAFAYAVLSDPRARQVYDKTGRTDGQHGDNDGDFDWSAFMADQYKVVINDDVIANVRREYVGSDEEREDVIAAYEAGRGSWSTIFERVMLSVMLDPRDEERFRGYIDAAIEDGRVKSHKAYHESEAQRSKRLKRAQRESDEAEQILKTLNVKHDPARMSENELALLIRSRNQNTSLAKLDDESTEALARHYEEKYGTPKKKKGKRKRDGEAAGGEPSEAEFQAAQERIKQRRAQK